MEENKKTDLEKLQDHTYYALVAFDKFASKHNLKYSLGFGTLLGAVRHKDFIPWDDDVDVVMPRDDYESFLKLAYKEFNEEFFIQNHLTEENNYHFFSRICINNTEAIQTLYKYIDNHKGIFIDIFPLDMAAPEKAQSKHLNNFLFLKRFKRIPSDNPSFLDKAIGFFTKLFSNKLSFQNINKKLDKLARKYNEKDTGYLFCSGDATGMTKDNLYFYYKDQIPSYSFDKLTMMKFRDREFPVFKNYDEVLSMQYGDYMKIPKESDREPHHGFEKFTFREDLIND